DQLSLGINAAYGVDKGRNTDSWYGAALYIDFTVNPGAETVHKLTLRTEYFNDKKKTNPAALVSGGEITSYTLTYTMAMYGGAFLIKPEVRYDQDLAKAGLYYAGANSQTTAAIAFIGTY
ncbi:MAG: outer membrane beta-barrel protein, partial [Leptospiraceae bacterium]|nr:outer membrane beta-barrel protein [Leptospiraceae bacterium]